jgi:hypothetical protein
MSASVTMRQAGQSKENGGSTVNQMNASVTMRQAGQSKKMAEARLSFEELSITISIQFFPFLKCVYIFGTLCTTAVTIMLVDKLRPKRRYLHLCY